MPLRSSPPVTRINAYHRRKRQIARRCGRPALLCLSPHHRDSPWSTRECGRGHVVETTVLLLTTWLSTSSLVLPGRRRRQQLSLLSTPCIPLLPALVDCQMPHDDTVVVIFVVIASVISHLVLTSALTPRQCRRRPKNTTAHPTPPSSLPATDALPTPHCRPARTAARPLPPSHPNNAALRALLRRRPENATARPPLPRSPPSLPAATNTQAP